jgi:collagenase-like PrtC family protease
MAPPAPRKPQLVCPAGSLRALTLAIDAGADAVYMGLKDATNARNFAGLNFDLRRHAKASPTRTHAAGTH